MIQFSPAIVLALALPLAFILGFSAHRAGICTVKAVAEVFTTRRAFMLIAFAKTALWVMLLTILIALIAGDWPPNVQRWALSQQAISGGLIFGVGAAVNGGCVFSSLTKLADGKFGLLVAVLAMPAGAALQYWVLAPPLDLPSPQAVVAPITDAALAGLLLAVLLVALIWELRRLLRSTAGSWMLRQRILAESYRLSTAAALIGLSNAFLLSMMGSWSFASVASRSITGDGAAGSDLLWLFWLVNLAAFAGMIASTLQRRSFAPQLPSLGAIVRHGGGGLMMGIGIVMIPGGNDSLLLYGIPALSPHALPAYAAILVGIALVFGVTRFMGRTLPAVHCTGDICRLS